MNGELIKIYVNMMLINVINFNDINNKHRNHMKEKILKILEEGKKFGYNNEAIANELLSLFNVSVSFEHGDKLCDCPECGAEIVYGLSKETMMIVKNGRLFK